MNDDKVLTTANLTVGYGDREIVKDVNIYVKPGEVVTLIGPNGSGKSTLLKTITGMLKRIHGEISICGKDAVKITDKEMAKILAMVMTDRLNTEYMNCYDIVASGRYPYSGRLGALDSEDKKKISDAMELMDVNEIANADFMKLSDGQKQRVMIARAICQDTDILVLDEPTSYLDMHYKLDILDRIRKLARKKNITVIMSLHELDLAEKISDYIVCVKDGRMDRFSSCEEVFAGDYLQKLYDVDEKCFDVHTGAMLLKGCEDEPKVFVIGGGGDAIPVYYRLQRENVPFAAGIIHENDIEYGIANATASKIIVADAFAVIGEDLANEAKKIIDDVDTVMFAAKKRGVANEANYDLLEYAKNSGKNIILC